MPDDKIKPKFRPEEHLIKLKGQDYLNVQWRVMWFREQCPGWTITTEYVVANQKVLAKAIILDDTGRVIGTSHKAIEGNNQYAMEKAETGAIGRALALCGYGTQFASDDFSEDGVVDSPVVASNKAELRVPEMRVAEPFELEPPQDNSLLQSAPKCCNKPMMISKFPKKFKSEWFCYVCKKSVERQV